MGAQPNPAAQPITATGHDIPTRAGGGSGPPPIPLSKADVVALLAAADHCQFPERARAMITFCYDTGCRVSELVGVTIGDLELDRNRVRFARRKTRDRLNLKIWSSTTRQLEEYLAFRRRLEGRTFLGQAEKVFRSTQPPYASLDRRFFNKLLIRLGTDAGVDRKRLFPHALRHGRAVAMLEDGAPLLAIQRRLGHANMATTLKYLDVAENWVDDWAQKAGRLDG